MGYDNCVLQDICRLIVDCPHSSAKDEGAGYPLIRTPNVGRGRLILNGVQRVSRSIYLSRIFRATPRKGDLILAREAPAGNVAIIDSDELVCLGQRTMLLRPDEKIVNPYFLAYYLNAPEQRSRLLRVSNGATVSHINVADVRKFAISLPSRACQDKVANILKSLDDAIALNSRTNGYLEELISAQCKHVLSGGVCNEKRADNLFEIGIGKTPPRKEHEWFSNTHGENVIWLSIKDMASSGAYAFDSSEYLTQAAVQQKHVRKVPTGSVLLSFKLTIGRVKIAATDMTTNEAIACFSSDDARKLSWLYPYLLNFDYSKLGNTSSIGTAVNSKTIKGMPIAMPVEKSLEEFYEFTKPLYQFMKSNQSETLRLQQLRDTLLPKLMSGEIDVSKVDLTQPNSHLHQFETSYRSKWGI